MTLTLDPIRADEIHKNVELVHHHLYPSIIKRSESGEGNRTHCNVRPGKMDEFLRVINEQGYKFLYSYTLNDGSKWEVITTK